MSIAIKNLRAKYGGNGEAAVRRAIRAEIIGGNELLDLINLVAAELRKPRADRHPALQVAHRTMLDQLTAMRDLVMAEAMIAKYADPRV